MALKDPRYTKFKIGWHREPTPDGTPKWWAEMGGVRVADAAMTGRTGVDDYPWDWSLTDAGESLRHADRGRHSSGVEDTLRAVKSTVDYLLRP
jgi:hypothetical protein